MGMSKDRTGEQPPELSPEEILLEDVGRLQTEGEVREYFLSVARTVLQVKTYYNDERFDKVVALITVNAPDAEASADAIRMYGRHNNRLEEQQRKKR
jgi:hypothetical protein